MSILDAQTLNRVLEKVSSRTHLFGVTATIQSGIGATSEHTDLSEHQISTYYALRRGSEVVATLRFITSRERLSRSPTLFAAAAQAADDVWSAEDTERTVEQFTDRLGQAYEQAHLLFRLAKIPENPSACAAALGDAIERLHGITHLG